MFLFLAFQLCIFVGPEIFVQNRESCYSYTRLFRAYILGMKMQFRGKEETEKNVKAEELEKSEGEKGHCGVVIFSWPHCPPPQRGRLPGDPEVPSCGWFVNSNRPTEGAGSPEGRLCAKGKGAVVTERPPQRPPSLGHFL